MQGYVKKSQSHKIKKLNLKGESTGVWESTKKEILGTEQLGKLSRELEKIEVDSQLCKRGLNSFIDEKSMKPLTDNLKQTKILLQWAQQSQIKMILSGVEQPLTDDGKEGN